MYIEKDMSAMFRNSRPREESLRSEKFLYYTVVYARDRSCFRYRRKGRNVALFNQ